MDNVKPESPESDARRRRWNVLLVFAVAMCTTASQGVIEIAYPLNLARIGYALPVIGAAWALMGIGSLVSRLPAGAWYRLARARALIAGSMLAFALTAGALALGDTLELQTVLIALHGAAFGLVTTFLLALVIEVRPRVGSAAGTIAWYTAAISTGYGTGSLIGAWSIERAGHGGAFVVSMVIGLLATVLMLALRRVHSAERRATPGATPRSALPRGGWLSGVTVQVWLATLLAFYINFVRDAYDTFFPIYALEVGIAVGTVGFLKSLQSLSATGIRFASAGLLHYVSAGVANHVSVLATAAGVVALSMFTSEWILVPVFVALGVCRGLIRVTTATVVAEEHERPGARVGVASGVYNAGLDAGGVFGPPLAGAVAAAFDIPTTFRIMAVVLPAFYYLVWFTQRGRARPPLAGPPSPGATM